MDTTTSGRASPFWLAEDHIDRHHLVGAARRQAVGARQVDQVERSGRAQVIWPFFVSTVTPG